MKIPQEIPFGTSLAYPLLLSRIRVQKWPLHGLDTLIDSHRNSGLLGVLIPNVDEGSIRPIPLSVCYCR